MDKKKSTMATPTLETFADQTQVFASAWSLINRQFGGEDSLERAEVERGILLDMARRLIEDHDAARQEIASLKAQPYDQQAMGLCHVCGWKGVIDYPDGPVCVACEHDKTLSPQPAAQAALAAKWQVVPRQLTQDMAAREQEDVGGWRRAGALLYRLTGEHRPTNFDEIRVTMANGSRDIGQMSAQAERLLAMLSAPQPTPQPLHVAATSCPHEIDKDKIVLHFDSKQPGKNALAQLAARLQAAQAQEDVPDMFWDADDTENFAHEIQDIIDGYGPGEIVTIECAKRLPNLRAVVTRDGDGISYEYLEAAIAAQQGGSA